MTNQQRLKQVDILINQANQTGKLYELGNDIDALLEERDDLQSKIEPYTPAKIQMSIEQRLKNAVGTQNKQFQITHDGNSFFFTPLNAKVQGEGPTIEEAVVDFDDKNNAVRRAEALGLEVTQG